MKIAYRTPDSVNSYFVRQLADAHHAKACRLQAGAIPKEKEFDLVIYDFDYLPTDERASLVRRLLSMTTRPARPIVVHGYHVDEQLKSALKARGVTVLRVLVPNMFKWFRPGRNCG
jgi:hypothetical protein